jgi:hypothetical protein
LLNRHYQAFALRNSLYLYRKRELVDCLKTAPNDRGIFSFATFKGDEHRLMLATLAEKSRCSLQLKDYTFNKEFLLENIFGDNQDQLQCVIGDVLLDDFGERLFMVNG